MMLDKFQLLVLSAILGTSYGDGSSDCTLSGLGATNQKGIDPAFMKQVAVPLPGPTWTDSGANIHFNTFNCDRVIKTGDAFTSMVRVGVRPLCNDAAGIVTPPRAYSAKLITPLRSVDNSTTQYQLIVKLADQVCPGQTMEVYMQVGVGGADPEIITNNKTFQHTYKMFWYQKDISQWNIMCDSSWKYVSQNYSTIRVWAQVPDVVFNNAYFDAQTESACPLSSVDPCVKKGYCCGPLSDDPKSQGGSFAVFKVPITACSLGSDPDPSVQCTFSTYAWGQDSAACRNLYGRFTTGIIVGATAFVALLLCVCLALCWRCRDNLSKEEPGLLPQQPVVPLAPVPYPYLAQQQGGAMPGQLYPYTGPNRVAVPGEGIFSTGMYADLSRPAESRYPGAQMTWGGA